jgi:hypothetical protein
VKPGSERGPGVGLAGWIVDRAGGFLDARLSRRSFIARATLLGSAIAASGCAVVTQPGSPYSRIADCGPNALCRDGFTEFCCSINDGVNACPPNTVPAGWWRADFSVYCNGTRYYIDCNEVCCGPLRSDGFCSGCAECRCAHGCDTRKVHCNYFRYGQCNQIMANVGPIACRMVTCVPPYQLDLGCSPSGAVDNSTANHFTDCSRYVPPPPPAPPPSTSVGSAASRSSGELLVAVRGADTAPYVRRLTGGQWSNWINLSGETTSRVVVASAHPGRADVFARSTDGALYQRGSDDGVNWSPWTRLADVVTSDPAALATAPGLWLFVRGHDGHLYGQRSNGNGWPGWTDLGGNVSGNPIPVAFGQQVFVFVRATDGAVYGQRYDGTAWSGWFPLGGSTDADPGAVAFQNTIVVFQKTGSALQARVFAAGTWGPWTELTPGNVASRPEPVVFGNRVYVFVRGVDQGVHSRVSDGTTWSDWTSLGGNSTVAPAPVVLGPTLFVFARGLDNALYSRTFDGTAWSPGWTDLGGWIAAVTAAG